MLQSVFRPLTNYLTTNWPVLWAARLDVALGCGLLLLVLDVPVFWLGRGVLQEQKWGTTDFGSIVAIIASLVNMGAIIVWVISVGRVYIRGMSPRMSLYPRFIDIFLGTIIIVTPTLIVIFYAAANFEQTGFSLKMFVTGMIIGSVALSIIFAFVLIAILRSSMRVALLSLIGVVALAGFVQTTITSAATRWFPPPPDKAETVTTSATIELFTAVSVIAFLVWVLSGTTRLRIRERLVTILFPALFAFALTIHDSALQLLGLAARGEKSGTDYLITYTNPQVAFVFAPLFLTMIIVLGEVLSRRWARLTLMPK